MSTVTINVENLEEAAPPFVLLGMGFWADLMEGISNQPGEGQDRQCPKCRLWSSSEDSASCSCGFDFDAAARLAAEEELRKRRNYEPPLVVPKPIPRDGQVVGYACIVCNRKIVFDADGAPCEQCQAPAHTKCLPHVHGTSKAGPYR